VTLAVIALLAGVAVGYARGGSLGRLATLRPTRNRLLVTGVGLYVVGVLLSWAWNPALAIFAGLALIAWAFYAWVNRAIHGAALIAAGLAANALVLLVNGAIPVSTEAAARAGADPVAVSTADNHQPADDDAALAWLGKSIPVAFPPRPEVVSPGDLAVAAGLAVAVSMGLTGRREIRPKDRAPDDHEILEVDPAAENDDASAPV
jgi:hypothetical protein